MLEAVCSLPKDRFKLSVIYFNDEWRKHLPAEGYAVYKCERGRLANGIKMVLLWLPSGLLAWRTINRFVHPLHRLLHQIKPHVVIYPGNDSYVYESHSPAVSPIFDLMHRYEPTFPEVSANGLREVRDDHYSKICKHAKAILVDSEVGKEHVIESYNVDESRIHVLPYVAPSYVYEYRDKPVALGRYRLPERYIYYPAQLWKHKNHLGLMKAMVILKERDMVVNAVFTGSRENGSEEFFQAVGDFGIKDQVYYLSYVTDEEIVALYKQAVALVMPTFFGPTNIPQLEAFALGCPVLTSNIYGIPEQVGDAALLFNPDDANDIADKIASVYCNEKARKTLIEKGYQKDSLWNQEGFNGSLESILEAISR